MLRSFILIAILSLISLTCCSEQKPQKTELSHADSLNVHMDEMWTAILFGDVDSVIVSNPKSHTIHTESNCYHIRKGSVLIGVDSLDLNLYRICKSCIKQDFKRVYYTPESLN